MDYGKSVQISCIMTLNSPSIHCIAFNYENNLFDLEGLFHSRHPSFSLSLSFIYASARLIREREANQRRERDRESSSAYTSYAA